MSTSLQKENDELKWRLRQLENTMVSLGREVSGAEREELEKITARFDSAAASFGETASPPMPGETPLAYRRRILQKLTPLSPQFKNARFDQADSPTLDAIEGKLFADARETTRNDATRGGKLICVPEEDGGRIVHRTYGDPMAWMQHFMTQGTIGYFDRSKAVEK